MRFLSVAPATVLLLLPLASTAADPAQEYQQVRKIALRDRHVQDAFAKANERLDEKIVQIDPALAGYVRSHPAGGLESASPRATSTPAKPAPAPASQKTHVVKAGETLSSIAAQYGISAENLQGTNRIHDARKLKVGQTLTIPAKP